jgi:hypothetical protein
MEKTVRDFLNKDPETLRYTGKKKQRLFLHICPTYSVGVNPFTPGRYNIFRSVKKLQAPDLLLYFPNQIFAMSQQLSLLIN